MFLVVYTIFALSLSSVWAETTVSPRTPTPVDIAKAGRPLLPIVICKSASPAIKAAAKDLRDYLERISGANFVVESTDTFTSETRGLLVGLAADFPDDQLIPNADEMAHREDYAMRSRPAGVWLAGATELGANHAVWDLLYRFGYRQFFPGETWEVIPKKPDLRISVDVHEHPDYLARRIWYGFGTYPENLTQFYDQWYKRNRVATGIDIANQHEYASIIQRNRAEFAAHPEYYALVNGNRTVWEGSQFCISNAGLRQLVVADALRRLENNPKLDCISIEPNDGGGWCECPQCAAMGSVTDRVVTLANEVARAMEQKYPDKYVGILAYNEHSPPPDIDVHPRVVVSIATAFIHGGYSVDQLIDGWGRHAQILGIYDYYSFFTWDWDGPGQARVSNSAYLKKTISSFYKQGVRFMNAESSNNWGPNGLGYYIASRLLWDTTQVNHVDEIVADFLDKAFGPAKAPMAKWYELIDGANNPLITRDLTGQMYRRLDEAHKLTTDPAIRARIYDLVLYTHYVEMLKFLKPSTEEFLGYGWRIRGTNMIHTRALWTINEASIPKEAAQNIPEPGNPWKSSAPFSEEELEKILRDGIANNPTINFAAVSYSTNLVPVTPLHLATTATGNFALLRGSGNFFTWLEGSGASVKFEASTGAATGARPGESAFTLFSPKGEGAVAEQAIPRDMQPYGIELKSSFSGLHSVVYSDGETGSQVTWPENVPLTFEASMKHPFYGNGIWSLYFYVPIGTKVVGGYHVCAEGSVVAPNGKVKLSFNSENNQDYWSVPVSPGEDGKLWQLKNIAGGQMRLMTVPPYLARSASELLLPKEVVDARQ